jgi:DnaK suppressor protein
MNASPKALQEWSAAHLEIERRDRGRIQAVLERAQSLLREQIAELAQQLAQMDAEAETDPGWQFERALVADRDARGRRALIEIDVALQRLADDQYGRCESCTTVIPSARLQVMPHTRLCVGCAGTRVS